MAGERRITASPGGSTSHYWEQLARRADTTALPDIQATARRWAGLWSVVAVVVPAFTPYLPTIDVASLSSFPQNWAICLFSASLLVALATIISGAMAAYGQPSSFAADGIAFRDAYRKSARNASRWFHVSRWAGGLAALLFALALIVCWVGTKQEQSYFVQKATGSNALGNPVTSLTCGQLAYGPGTDYLVIVPTGGIDAARGTPIPVTATDELEETDHCPKLSD